MPLEKERRSYFSAANILTLLMMLGALAGVWAGNAAENADTKRRLSVVESRQEETRREIKDTAHEIKQDVKDTKTDVQLILRKLDTMEALQRQRVERERR